MNKKIKSLVLSLALLVSSAAPVFAADVTRIAGSDRYETALLTNKKYFYKAYGNLAVITCGNDFRTALYGSYMANALKVPNYVIPNTGLSKSMMNELHRLHIRRAYVIGDYKTLNKSIDNSLSSIGIRVRRFYDKFEDDYPVPVYQYIDAPIFETFFYGEPRGDTSNGIIINDNKFPDLLSAIPFLSELTRKEGTFLGSYQDFDSNNGFRFIIGGYESVPPEITTFEGDVPGLNLNTYNTENPTESDYFYSGRISGTNRYATAVEIANSYSPVLKKQINTAVIVNGEDYPDALTSGIVATHTNGAILLTQPNVLNQATKKYIEDNNIKNIIIVGGENSVSKSVENELRALN